MKRILVVDDNSDILTALTELLESEGYLVVPCRSGEEAVTSLSASADTPFHCVVLDNFMPGITGQEMIGLMDAPDFPLKNVPPVVMSTTNPRSINLTGVKLKVVMLQKPLGIDQLLEVIESFPSVKVRA